MAAPAAHPRARMRRPVVSGAARVVSGAARASRPDVAGLRARTEALRRLNRVEEGGAYAALVHRKAKDALSPRDERFVVNVVNGVTRWRRYLDYVVLAYYSGSHARNQDAKRKPGDMDPIMLSVLRMGVYELVKLGTKPHVVNTYVELTKRVVHRNAGGLANYLLRAVARATHENALPVPPGHADGDDEVRTNALSILHSHPKWLVRRWRERYGESAAVELMEYFNAPPTHFVVRPSLPAAARPNDIAGAYEALTATCEELNVPYKSSGVLPGECVRVTGNLQGLVRSGAIGVHGFHGAARDVAFCVQDEAQALVVAAALDPQPGERILDACAAPGGKSLFALNRLGGRGALVALDRSATRLRALETTASALGYGAPHFRTHATDLVEWDGTLPPSDGGKDGAIQEVGLFDKVLLDVPCSGTGVLHRRADMRWRRREEDVAQVRFAPNNRHGLPEPSD